MVYLFRHRIKPPPFVSPGSALGELSLTTRLPLRPDVIAICETQHPPSFHTAKTYYLGSHRRNHDWLEPLLHSSRLVPVQDTRRRGARVGVSSVSLPPASFK